MLPSTIRPASPSRPNNKHRHQRHPVGLDGPEDTLPVDTQKQDFRNAFHQVALKGVPTRPEGGEEVVAVVLPATRASGRSSALLSKQEYDSLVDGLERLADDRPILDPTFLKTIYHHARKKFVVVEPNGQRTLWQKPLRERDPNEPETHLNRDRRLVCQDDVFDILFHFHRETHNTSNALFGQVKWSYANISEKLCQAFVKLCPTCSLRQEQKIQGTTATKRKRKKKIHDTSESCSFRDRFLLDLIDYSSTPAVALPDVQGAPIYKYLLLVKDHATRFVYARPLQTKLEKEVVYELTHLFNFMGYPQVLHPSSAFQGIDFAAALNADWPTIKVERCTRKFSMHHTKRPIKECIERCILGKQMMGYPPGADDIPINWATQYTLAVQMMNTTRRREDNLEPYQLVFGKKPSLDDMNTVQPSQDDGFAPYEVVFGRTFHNHAPEGTRPMPEDRDGLLATTGDLENNLPPPEDEDSYPVPGQEETCPLPDQEFAADHALACTPTTCRQIPCTAEPSLRKRSSPGNVDSPEKRVSRRKLPTSNKCARTWEHFE